MAIRLILFLLGFVWTTAAAASCEQDQVEIKTRSGSVTYSVEIADGHLSRARGLMNRDTLCGQCGMLFLYNEQRRVSFWMRNVRFPLDMIFIDGSGRVAGVFENAQPHGEVAIHSPVPVIGVLEIRGGASRHAQITLGDLVRHPWLITCYGNPRESTQ